MTIADILSEIDVQIDLLQKAKAILAGSTCSSAKVTSHVQRPTVRANGKRKKRMSAEGRASIAEAQRKRWAAIKRTK